MVFLHGYPTASWDYAYIWEDFSNHRRVTLDFLGFGFSDKPRMHNYSIAEQATIVESLLRNLGIKKVKIVAHDYAVSVAQELLARELDGKLTCKIESVVFLNGGLIATEHRPRLIQKLLNGFMGPAMVQLMSKFSFKLNFSAIFGKNTRPTQAEIDSLWYLMNYPKRARVSDKLLHYMSERHQYQQRWVGALQNTKIPLRLIDGLDDPVSGAHLADAYEREVPNADVVRLPGIGHYPQVEAASDVVKNIQGFKRGGY